MPSIPLIMTILKTHTRHLPSGVLETAAHIHSETIADGAQSSIFDTTSAKSVIIVSNKVLTIKVPAVDSEGVATTDVEAAVVDSDLHKNPTASKAGFISGDLMPPFFTLTNASGTTATVYIYIMY